MGQDLSLSIGARVSELDVGFQFLDVVCPLLSNKDQAAFEADLAEGLLVVNFQVSLQGL